MQFLFDEFTARLFPTGEVIGVMANQMASVISFVVLARTGFVKRTRTFVRNDLMTLTQRLLNFMIGTYLSSPVLYVGRQIEPCPVRCLFSSLMPFPHQTLSYESASKGLGDPIEPVRHEIGLERTHKRGLGRNTCRFHEPSTPLIRCLILNAMTALGPARAIFPSSFTVEMSCSSRGPTTGEGRFNPSISKHDDYGGKSASVSSGAKTYCYAFHPLGITKRYRDGTSTQKDYVLHASWVAQRAPKSQRSVIPVLDLDRACTCAD